MKKKKLILAVTGCLLISILTIGGTLAWLTDQEQVKNVATIGNVNIEINEEWEPEDGLNIVPDVDITKKPSVKNIGANPAYIRAKVVFSDSYYNDYVELDYNLNDTNGQWFRNGDYYYYNQIVIPGESTTPLFTQFKLSSNYIEPPIGVNPGFDIDVYAEAIQSQGFEPSENTEASFASAILDAFRNYMQPATP